ncbi:hypothetical protein N7463_003296 [Penicillium fimorum]|uniref:Mid2-like cell wall stress sensor n=1 Tax=Penicillium fimorum TaxID=1882269 RepID=A0A9W9Y0Q1_9EURO|nr:hypothetical protein N7463_003296 [Penicillium fimorum]
MRISIFALCTVLCSPIRAQPYASEIAWISATTTSVGSLWLLPEPSEVAHLYGKRGYDEILQARDTTATADATTDTAASETTEPTSSETTTSETTTSETTTSETTTSETTTSETTTSETTSSTTETTTATPTSETTTSTTDTTSSTASSSVTASSTSASASTPASTSSVSATTSATATATGSMSKAELAEWNHRGNIAAIVFGCCFIAIFLGVAIVYYALGRAKARRIAASQLSNSSQSYSKMPLVAVQEPHSTDLEINRSSTQYTNNPQAQYNPAVSDPSVSNYSDTPSAVSPITADHSFPRDHILRGHQ